MGCHGEVVNTPSDLERGCFFNVRTTRPGWNAVDLKCLFNLSATVFLKPFTYLTPLWILLQKWRSGSGQITFANKSFKTIYFITNHIWIIIIKRLVGRNLLFCDKINWNGHKSVIFCPVFIFFRLSCRAKFFVLFPFFSNTFFTAFFEPLFLFLSILLSTVQNSSFSLFLYYFYVFPF